MVPVQKDSFHRFIYTECVILYSEYNYSVHKVFELYTILTTVIEYIVSPDYFSDLCAT